jgi:lathosterol oxidase
MLSFGSPPCFFFSIPPPQYFREFHFYWAHRLEHPFGWKGVWAYLDVGKWLYQVSHSLHHQSKNPGPFAGMSMHPIEHFMYFTCAALPFVFTSVAWHPMHFIFAIFHACIAPIGGHDGYDNPGGGGDFHYLHHHLYECNYGVPLIDFDRLFGSWVEFSSYKLCGDSLTYAKAYDKALAKTGDKDKALAEVAKQFNTTVDAVTGKKKVK